MADQSLIDRKLDVSRQLVDNLRYSHAPLLAAYWDWSEERSRWIFCLVPKTPADESKLIDEASKTLIEAPYRSIFSLSDVVVDGHQIARARAIGSYIRTVCEIVDYAECKMVIRSIIYGFPVLYLDAISCVVPNACTSRAGSPIHP